MLRIPAGSRAQHPNVLSDCCRESVSEEIRLYTVQILASVLKSAVLRPSCCEILREESSAPLVGHLLSSLLQIAEQELRAGSTGSRQGSARACSSGGDMP